MTAPRLHQHPHDRDVSDWVTALEQHLSRCAAPDEKLRVRLSFEAFRRHQALLEGLLRDRTSEISALQDELVSTHV